MGSAKDSIWTLFFRPPAWGAWTIRGAEERMRLCYIYVKLVNINIVNVNFDDIHVSIIDIFIWMV